MQAGPVTSLTLHCLAVHHLYAPRGLCILSTHCCFYMPASSSCLLAPVAQGFHLTHAQNLPVEHGPLSWGSAIQETARDLRGVNEPADIKLRSKAVLTPRVPVRSHRRSRCFRIILPCEPHFHALAPPPSSVLWKNVSLHSHCSHQEQKLRQASAEFSRREY